MEDETVNICLSGGAIGSDYLWGYHASANGHSVVHLSFAGHGVKASEGTTVLRLSQEELVRADPYLLQAIIDLKRAPLDRRTPRVQGLLRRNWWQIRDVTGCYAISTFKKGHVAGGTGYAVQMYLNRMKSELTLPPPYVFDQQANKWFVYNRSWARWDPIARPPSPTGRYAGIGTRDINADGANAIKDVYK